MLERFEANQDRKFDQIRREIKEIHQKLEQTQQKFEYRLDNKIEDSIRRAFNELKQKMDGLNFDNVIRMICVASIQISLTVLIISSMKIVKH